MELAAVADDLRLAARLVVLAAVVPPLLAVALELDLPRVDRGRAGGVPPPLATFGAELRDLGETPLFLLTERGFEVLGAGMFVANVMVGHREGLLLSR